jgi:hypothetical protein
MIIGRENTERELQAQQYLVEKIHPCLSELTQELLKSKPQEPIPAMITVLNNMALQS